MTNLNTKTYLYKSFIDRETILNKINLFKEELINSNLNSKYILLNIELINYPTDKKSEVISIELISEYKFNFHRKIDKIFNAELNRKIQFIKKYANLNNVSDIKNMTFKEIKLTFNPISYYQYVNKDEIQNLINKMIKKIN